MSRTPAAKTLDPTDMILWWAQRCAGLQEISGSDCDHCSRRVRCQKAADAIIGRLYTSRAVSRIKGTRKN